MSRSTNKLELLTKVASQAIKEGALKEFKTVEASIKWELLCDGGDSVWCPNVTIKLEK